MTPYDEQLASAVAAVWIDSPSAYWWFDKRSARIPRNVKQALTAETARDFLRFSLQLRLYNDFYCKGVAIPSKREAVELRAAASNPFIGQLSAANCGEGFWGHGWEVDAIDGAAVVVQRDGLRLRVRPGECRLSAGPHNRDAQPLSGGDKVGLRYPKELLGMSPGFYMALGNQEMTQAASDRAVRLYWNVTPDGAVRFLRHATSGLNRAAIPFKIKVLNDPRRFVRCDAVVVYIGKPDYSRAGDVLRDAHAAVEDALKPGTPAFTKPLHASVGLAEDPGGGESFGLHRCGIVAEGLIRAFEQGLYEDAERIQAIGACFEERGLRLDSPFLNPGSRDDYGESTLATRLAQSVRAPSHAVRSDGARTAPETGDGEFLDTAVAIGRRLQQQAIWHQDRCTWLGYSPRGHGVADGRVYETLGPDLYEGTSGVALFFAELSAATGDRDARALALGAMRQAFTKLDDVAPAHRIALFLGWPGIAVAGARVAAILDDAPLRKATFKLMQRALQSDRSMSENDLLAGRAGAIVAAVTMQAGTPTGAVPAEGRSDTPADIAIRLADELLQQAVEEDRGCSWRSVVEPGRRGLTGYSHGAAGIGHALLELFDVTGDSRYRAHAEMAFAYERAWFDAGAGNWFDFRDEPKLSGRRAQRAAPRLTRCSSTWCNGAPGIALSRIRAREILGDGSCSAEAAVALRTTCRTVEAWLADGTTNYALCHGLAGNADVLLHGARRFGDAAAERLAREVGQFGIARYAKRGHQWPCGTGGGEAPGLMLGLAGIGHFYLRLHASATPSVLLLGPGYLSMPAADASVPIGGHPGSVVRARDKAYPDIRG